MKSKIKILAMTLVIVAVASVFLYAPLTNALQPNGDPESDLEILNDMNFEARCRCNHASKLGEVGGSSITQNPRKLTEPLLFSSRTCKSRHCRRTDTSSFATSIDC